MQKFHIKFAGFLLLLVESGQSDTSRTPITLTANPSAIGNRKEQQIQDSVWSRVHNTDSHWSESQEYNIDIRQRQLESGQWQHLPP